MIVIQSYSVIPLYIYVSKLPITKSVVFNNPYSYLRWVDLLKTPKGKRQSKNTLPFGEICVLETI